MASGQHRFCFPCPIGASSGRVFVYHARVYAASRRKRQASCDCAAEGGGLAILGEVRKMAPTANACLKGRGARGSAIGKFSKSTHDWWRFHNGTLALTHPLKTNMTKNNAVQLSAELALTKRLHKYTPLTYP